MTNDIDRLANRETTMKKNLLQELVVDRAGLVWAYQFHHATAT